MKKTSSVSGFTLIELLVVIAIIGILASVVLASLNSARSKGRDAKRISDVKQLQLALELGYDAAQQYPLALTTAALVTPGYISVIPTDPSTGGVCTDGTQAGCYKYAPLNADSSVCSSEPCPKYVIGATLEVANNTVLDSDIDGTVGGIACADPTFCQTP